MEQRRNIRFFFIIVLLIKTGDMKDALCQIQSSRCSLGLSCFLFDGCHLSIVAQLPPV